MFKQNFARNKAIHELWEDGHTVVEIARRTGYPRSSVGYYVRKFNALAAAGQPIVIPEPRKDRERLIQEVAERALAKEKFADIILEPLREPIPKTVNDEDLRKELFVESRMKQVYYKLGILKMMKQDFRHFDPDKGALDLIHEFQYEDSKNTKS